MEREVEKVISAYFDLNGATALITGGASGLGKATADRMLRSNVAYSAAKGGVVNLTKAAGSAYAGQGIRVNCVCPGVINTPLVPESEKEKYRQIHPMHRIGEDFEIASIITFLCCENARFITGAAIPVDGGYTSV